MTATVQMPAEVTGPNAPEPGNNTPASSQQAPTSTSNERPSWLPEKFESGEALAKAYSELEARFTQTQQHQQKAPVAPAVSEQQAMQQLQSQGLDLNSFQQEYAANGGKLSEASYAKLEQAGFSRQFVDDYIRGQEAIAQQEINAVYAEVGGEAEFQKVAAWARSNLPAHEVAAFNSIVESASVEALRLAVAGLHAKYVAANGQEPRLVNGQAASSVQGFASRYEMIEAMRDPRYRKDEAYREMVTQKLATSDIF